MYIIMGIILFLAGVAVGGIVVYKMEEKRIDDMLDRCSDTTKRLDDMLKQEEQFIETMWPKKNPHITMETNMADYLRGKYFNNEDRDWSDCEDESDNLYI